MKRWLTRQRRGLCQRLGHPMAEWSPTVVCWYEPDSLLDDGKILAGLETRVRAWRCAVHDRRPT